MLDEGLENEARQLFDAGGEQFAAGKGIGYREFFPYFNLQQTLPDTVAQIKQDTRHYAKRQLTWFRHQVPVTWFDIVQHPEQLPAIRETVSQWLQN